MSLKLNMRITGKEELNNNLNSLPKKAQTIMRKAVELAAQIVKDTSDSRFCPIDSATLKNTSNIRLDPNTSIIAAYINYTSEYALIVHEDITKRHGEAFNAVYGAGLRGNEQCSRFLVKAMEVEKDEVGALLEKIAKRILQQ